MNEEMKMSKYIVEFDDTPVLKGEGLSHYRCLDAPWWIASEFLISKFTPYKQDEEESKDTLTAGDEVTFSNNYLDEEFKAVVVDESDEPDVFLVLTENGCIEAFDKNILRKTGRRYHEIEDMLEAMRGTDNK